VWHAVLWERSSQGACEGHACGMRPTKQPHAGCVWWACVWRAGLRKRITQGACEEHACGMRSTKQKHAGCV